MAKLINVAHVKDYIRERSKAMRPEFPFSRISDSAVDDIDTAVRLLIDKRIQAHPSIGVTFKP